MVTKAGQSIAGFKLREGQSIGAKVTLRGDRMWEFFDRLLAIAIPRIRDFRGLPSTSWDGRGNYTFGVTEQLIFPEIDYDRVDVTRGMDITIVTTAVDDEGGQGPARCVRLPVREERRRCAPQGAQPWALRHPGQQEGRQAGGPEQEEVTGHEMTVRKGR